MTLEVLKNNFNGFNLYIYFSVCHFLVKQQLFYQQYFLTKRIVDVHYSPAEKKKLIWKIFFVDLYQVNSGKFNQYQKIVKNFQLGLAVLKRA